MPTIRYLDERGKGTFWISTTLVFDDLPRDDVVRWDNFFISSSNLFNSISWTDPVHFKFGGNDMSLLWDDDEEIYVVGSHEY